MTVYQKMDKDGNIVETIEKELSTAGDCWLVQFEGLKKCAFCQYFGKPDCGGSWSIVNALDDYMLSKGARLDKQLSPIEKGIIYDCLSVKDMTIYHTMKQDMVRRFPKFLKKAIRQIREDDKMSKLQTVKLDDLFPYDQISTTWKLLEKSGYHQCTQCNCSFTTKKGAYRDEIYNSVAYNDANKLGGTKLCYYHQHCIAAQLDKHSTFLEGKQFELDKGFYIDSCGYKTKTTKDRINNYIRPLGYNIYQERNKWYLHKGHWNTESKTVDFIDGMNIFTV